MTDVLILTLALDAAVPLWILKHKDTCPDDRMYRAHYLADIIAGEGDNILFRGPKAGDTARAFNALAEGLALMAYVPGGVTFAGRHWVVGYLGENAGDEWQSDFEAFLKVRDQ
jgi:hypothetical protein